MKLILQQLGTVWLIGIETFDADERQGQFWSLWNHGATSANFHEMSDGFGYIVSDEERVKRYFLNSSLHLLLNKFPDTYKGVKGGVMEDARKLAARRLAELMENQECFVSTNPIVYDYSIGKIEPLANFSQVKPFDEEEWKSRAANQRSRLESA